MTDCHAGRTAYGAHTWVRCGPGKQTREITFDGEVLWTVASLAVQNSNAHLNGSKTMGSAPYLGVRRTYENKTGAHKRGFTTKAQTDPVGRQTKGQVGTTWGPSGGDQGGTSRGGDPVWTRC